MEKSKSSKKSSKGKKKVSKKSTKGGCGGCMLVGGAGDLYQSSPVIELKLIRDYLAKERNVDDFMLELQNERFKAAKQGLITFYSPSCPHCKDMKEMYTELAEKVSKNVPIAAVNADDAINGNEILADYMKVKAYPTITWYDGSNYTLYEGPRDLESLMRFVCVKSGKCKFGYPVNAP